MDYYDSVMRDQEGGAGTVCRPSKIVCRRGSWPPCRPEPHNDTQILFTTAGAGGGGGGGGGAFRIQSDCVSEVRSGVAQRSTTAQHCWVIGKLGGFKV